MTAPAGARFVAYYRVSTDKQGRSGLALHSPERQLEKHLQRQHALNRYVTEERRPAAPAGALWPTLSRAKRPHGEIAARDQVSVIPPSTPPPVPGPGVATLRHFSAHAPLPTRFSKQGRCLNSLPGPDFRSFCESAKR